MLRFLETLRTRFRDNSEVRKVGEAATLCGKQGPEGNLPELSIQLSKTHTEIVASHSGPEGGVAAYRNCAPDLDAAFDQPADWAYGVSTSMYDHAPSGRRNGEPVADCFGILGYSDGAVLAVADGVNWGEPPRRAARCAVLGALSHIHASLKHHEHDSELTTNTVFQHMVASVNVAQKLILQQFGTLTTLVVSVVLPAKWLRSPRRWAVLTLSVGDSAAYCYRARTRTVEEITAASHADGIRDPRWCPGALGYALGEEPDLTNMMLCLTLMDEGDFVFLTSDGVADNFDPVIRKLARHQVLAQQMLESAAQAETELPSVSPSECQAMAMQLLGDALRTAHKSADLASQQLTARFLVDHILQHVSEVTEEHRQQVEARNREREKGTTSRDLNTDRGLMAVFYNRLPGKMDHATCVAYQIGRHKHAVSSEASSPAHDANTNAHAHGQGHGHSHEPSNGSPTAN